MYKRVISTIILFVMIFQIGSFITYAFDPPTPAAPQMLRVQSIEQEPPIGYNQFDGNYVDLDWNMTFPPGSTGNFLNFYKEEIPKGYNNPSPRTLVEGGLSGDIPNYRVRNLPSGTMFYLDMRAYSTYTYDGNTYTSSLSPSSNRVKVLTDIEVNAYAVSENRIKIEWDDVWNVGGRIGYRLYISETDSFANTPPIYINQSHIGPGKIIEVNESTGKLEYEHKVNAPGRMYYIKIEPDINEPELYRTAEGKTVIASSFIMVNTSKVSTTETGTVWRLEWVPVRTGDSDPDIEITYQIYRGNSETQELPQYMATVNDTSFFVTLQSGEDSYYYIIRTVIQKNGLDLYPGIRIESDEIVLGEEDVPSTPSVPEFVDKFERVEGDIIISYDENLKHNEATVLWRAMKSATGELDTNVTYDMWLLQDPNLIDNPPMNSMIESSYNLNSTNLIYNAANLVGHKYTLQNLSPNSTYYFKIVAKKTYLEYKDETIQEIVYKSEPAIKIIITPPEGPMETPLAPQKAPFRIKTDPDDTKIITQTSATVQFKNLWYEAFNSVENKWEYIRTEKTSESDVPDFIPEDTLVDGINYRKVNYDEGITVNIGCIPFEEGMDVNNLHQIPADYITGVSIQPNDPLENPNFNPSGQRHNVDVQLTNLEPNTMYLIWMRAVRNDLNLISPPSDPILITTTASPIEVIERPRVPSFNYSLAYDTYADIGWELREGYNYNLKYSTQDDINTASNERYIRWRDFNGLAYYRVRGLNPDTSYYFWVQAETISSTGEVSLSGWSDSYSIKTTPIIPPDSPKGFGIKSVEDAITKDSIFFEWIREPDLEYVIEIARDQEFTNATKIELENVSEKRVEELQSNYRYYARLFAFDPSKNMISNPTSTLSIVTARSNDEFDSNVDLDDEIVGEFIEKSFDPVKRKWDVAIQGVNAIRFIEFIKNDNNLDYRINLNVVDVTAKEVNIVFSRDVFTALDNWKKNIIIEAEEIDFIIRPGTFPKEIPSVFRGASDINYNINISLGLNNPLSDNDILFKTRANKIEAKVGANGNLLPVDKFESSIRVRHLYEGQDWYTHGITAGFIKASDSNSWEKTDTNAVYYRDYNQGYINFNIDKPSYFIIGEYKINNFSDMFFHKYESSINRILTITNLPSAGDNRFFPDDSADLGDVIKFIFDILEYPYSHTFMNDAARGGFIQNTDINKGTTESTVEQAVLAGIRMYEIITGDVIGGRDKKLEFANRNGIFVRTTRGNTKPFNEVITRGETILLLERILELTGILS